MLVQGLVGKLLDQLKNITALSAFILVQRHSSPIPKILYLSTILADIERLGSDR